MQHPTGNETLSLDQLSRFRFAKPDDLRRLEREQQELSWSLDGRSQYDGERLFGEQMPERLQGGTAPDQDHLRTLMVKNQQTLEASRPPLDLTELQKRRYMAMYRELTADIKEGLLSVDQQQNPTESNVEQELAWQYYKARKAIARANIMQMLDPTNDSPFFTSIEVLRPTSPPTVDLRKLRMNWDHITFTDAQDRADIQIDDTVYVQFLRLKALDWSDKGIMKELGMSRAALEVAMQRLVNDRMGQPEPEVDDDDEEEGETPVPPEAPAPPEPDEEAPVQERVYVRNGVTAPAPAPAPEPAPVPGIPLPPAHLEKAHQKGAWLRDQLAQRHMAVSVMARALGLKDPAPRRFAVRVSKGDAFTDAEWQAMGRIMATVDADPTFLLQYGGPLAWERSLKHTKANAKVRAYPD